MKPFIRVLALSFGLTALSAHACLRHEDPSVVVSGRVVLRTFFGPPNYGESPETDSKEEQALLLLDMPICVDALNHEKAEKEQSEITLVPMGAFSLSGLAGRRVKAQGSLFHAITGHHHTQVLIALQQPPVEVK